MRILCLSNFHAYNFPLTVLHIFNPLEELVKQVKVRGTKCFEQKRGSNLDYFPLYFIILLVFVFILLLKTLFSYLNSVRPRISLISFSANLTKWSNLLKYLVGYCRRIV